MGKDEGLNGYQMGKRTMLLNEVLVEAVKKLDYWRDDYGLTGERMKEIILIVGTGIFRELSQYTDEEISDIIRVHDGEAKNRRKPQSESSRGMREVSWWGA